MGYNLVIDQGNSTAKIALFEGDRIVEFHRHERLLPGHLDEIKGDRHIDAAIYCSVSRPLRYFDTLEASMPIVFASCDCERCCNCIICLIRPIIAS